MPSAGDRSTILLLHGAYHGGWCYIRVKKLLEAAGHIVYTPTLSGLGERSHQYSPNINASTHIQDIINVFVWEDLRDVVLVAHSYGGLIATGVADAIPERIRALVYLDAFVAEDGKSLLDMDTPAALAFHTESARSNGGHTIPPTPSAAFAVNEKDQAWVDRLCTAQPFATFAERLKLSGKHKTIKNRTYVFATGWNTSFQATYDRIRAEGGWKTHEFVGAGHDVMVDRPRETADVILSAVMS